MTTAHGRFPALSPGAPLLRVPAFWSPVIGPALPGSRFAGNSTGAVSIFRRFQLSTVNCQLSTISFACDTYRLLLRNRPAFNYLPATPSCKPPIFCYLYFSRVGRGVSLQTERNPTMTATFVAPASSRRLSPSSNRKESNHACNFRSAGFQPASFSLFKPKGIQP